MKIVETLCVYLSKATARSYAFGSKPAVYHRLLADTGSTIFGNSKPTLKPGTQLTILVTYQEYFDPILLLHCSHCSHCSVRLNRNVKSVLISIDSTDAQLCITANYYIASDG
jgi:hypothetical protein